MWPPRKKDAQDDLFALALSEAKRRGALPGKTEIVSPLCERDKENVEGGFYVEQGACMICSLPPETAPNLVRMRLDKCGHHKDSHCYFFRQPYSPEELELAVEALVGSWDSLCRSPLEDLIGVLCPVCHEGIEAWYGWDFSAMNANCEKLCSCVRIDGLSVPPPWAEPNANTTIRTDSGERIVDFIPPEQTFDEIDAERGIMKARLRLNGWTKCPYCGKSFATYAQTSWNDGRHVSCGTRLALTEPKEPNRGE